MAKAARRYILDRPANKARVLDFIVLDGKSDMQVAEAMKAHHVSVTRQAITAFRHRHVADLKERGVQAVKAIADYGISQKVNRIARMDERWQLLQQVRTARGAEMGGEAPGGETGLIIRKLKNIGSGEFAETVTEYAIDTPALAAELALEKAAAEELGQLPKPDTHITNNSVVLIREVVIHGGHSTPLG